MRSRMTPVTVALALVAIATVTAFAQGMKSRELAPAPHPNGKRGGVLLAMHREDLAQGFSIHETATISTTWPKQVGIEAALKQVETAQWHPLVTRREYQMGANVTGLGVDDPDANFYENFACDSPRNYTGYCDEQVMKMIDAQSQELDVPKRAALVAQIQRKLEEDAARPVMGWRLDYFPIGPYVKNLVPHHNIYNYGRMQEIWLDR